MDVTEIITAGIAAVAAVSGSAIVQSKATAVLQAKFEALREDVHVLSARVDKHNNLIDRTTKLECKVENLEKEK